jgi:hypothetical protein
MGFRILLSGDRGASGSGSVSLPGTEALWLCGGNLLHRGGVWKCCTGGIV